MGGLNRPPLTHPRGCCMAHPLTQTFSRSLPVVGQAVRRSFAPSLPRHKQWRPAILVRESVRGNARQMQHRPGMGTYPRLRSGHLRVSPTFPWALEFTV